MEVDNGIRFVRFVRIVDGDTFFCLMDLLPVGISPQPQLLTKIRVRDWNAPELSEPVGQEMRAVFAQLLQEANRIDVAVLRPRSTRARMTHDRIEAAVFLDGVLFVGLLEHKLMELKRARNPEPSA